mgnify:FL=1
MRSVLFVMVAMLTLAGCRNRDIIEPSVKPDSDRVVVSYEAQDVEIGIESNVDISVDVVSDWATLISVDGGKRSKIKVHIEENFEREPRSANLVVTAGEIRHTVLIMQEKSPHRMSLTIDHSGRGLTTPTWEGEDVCGTIDWGDGSSEKYDKGVKHSYEVEGEYKALFDMQGPIGFKIEQLGEISSIAISYN